MKDYGNQGLPVCRELLLKAPEGIWLAMSREGCAASLNGNTPKTRREKGACPGTANHEHLVAVKDEHV